MGCGCGSGGARAGIAYKIVSPDGSLSYATTVGEARAVKASYGSPATVVMQVSEAEMKKWQAEQDASVG